MWLNDKIPPDSTDEELAFICGVGHEEGADFNNAIESSDEMNRVAEPPKDRLMRDMFNSIRGGEYDDVKVYNQAVNMCREGFLKKRDEHGSHLEKDDQYFRSGTDIKCCRTRQKIKENKPLSIEDVMDEANYLLMMLSRMIMED